MKIQRSFKINFTKHFEWIALSAGLLLMAMLDPATDAQTFCPIERMGFNYCPGEGLGRSISLAFRGDFLASLAMHPAGIAAIFILSGRIYSIIKENHITKKAELTS